MKRYFPIIVLAFLVISFSTVSPQTAQSIEPLSHKEVEPPWEQTNGPTGAPMDSIVSHPTNSDILYAAGLGGGVYKSINGGENWLFQNIPGVSFSERLYSLAIDLNNPETLFAVNVQGVFKTTNGGQSWAAANNGIQECHRNIHKIVIDPLNENVLYVGTKTHCPGIQSGALYKSTNGGQSWMQISTNINMPLTGGISALSAVGSHVYIGVYDDASENEGDLYYSGNGGTTWSKLDIGKPQDTYVYSVFIDPENVNETWVGLNSIYNIAGNDILYLTTNGGSSWKSVQNYPGFEETLILGKSPDGKIHISNHYSEDTGVTWHTWENFQQPFSGDTTGTPNAIAFSPTDEDTMYVSLFFGSGLAKTTDGGTTWFRINDGLLNTSISLLAAHPWNGRVLYASGVNGEGTFKSTDAGNSWVWLTNKGITHPWADELVINPHSPENVWEIADVGTIFQTTNGGSAWDANQGDGFRYSSIYAIAAAESDPDILYALRNGFGIYRSDDGGSNWRFLHQSDVDYTYSLAVHPTNPDIVYSGYTPKPFQSWATVRQSMDGGDTWRTALYLSDSQGITSVAIDPTDPDTVYAGNTGTRGAIWHSANNGNDWQNVNEAFDFTNIHALAADPTDPNTAYAAVWGGGTFKTSNAGQTWEKLSTDPTISTVAILIDPSNNNVVYLADRTSAKVYRTVDGGISWETYFDAGPGYYRVLSAAISPSDPTNLYVSVFSTQGPMSGDLFHLQNGISTKITGGLPRLPVGITVDPNDADTLYAVLHGQGVYKTTNVGENWTDISGNGSGLPQTPHVGFNSVVVDPATGHLYLLGGSDVDTDLSHTGADPFSMYTIFKSTNGGNNWTNLNDGNLGTNSLSIKGLAIAPADSDVLYAGSLNGVFRSTDGGSSWTNINASLNYTHTAGVALSSDGSDLYAPMLGGGVYVGDVNSITNDVLWDPESHLASKIYHVQVTVDPTNSTILYASAYPGGIFKSINGGETWVEANFGMASFKIDDPSRQGYYAFEIAPANPDIIYLGLYGVGIYKSTDGAGTWRPMNGVAQTMRGQNISALFVDPSDEDKVYVATEEGVYRSLDGGQNWSSYSNELFNNDIRTLAGRADGVLLAGSRGNGIYWIDETELAWQQMGPLFNYGTFWPIWNRPLYQYSTLLFHPENPNVIYLGTFPTGIYKSIDGGQTWREHNVGWTNDGVFSLVFHPDNPEIVYAGTYNGVNRSIDGGEHWQIWDSGWPAEQWVFSIDFDPRNPNVMYACSKNGENQGAGREDFHGIVMKSVDGGENWSPIMSGLDDQEFYKIIVDKNEPDILYLATQYDGVYISRNGGNQWEPWNDGLSNLTAGTNGNNVTNTMVLSADGRYLFFGTSGSGVYRRELPTFQGHFNYLPMCMH